jgi:hypothetical protein
MKHLKKFENFYVQPQLEDEPEDISSIVAGRSSDYEDTESEIDYSTTETPDPELRDVVTYPETFEARKSKAVSYKKSGLKRPDLADRNKNKKIEGWEKAVAKKIEKSIDNKKKKK